MKLPGDIISRSSKLSAILHEGVSPKEILMSGKIAEKMIFKLFSCSVVFL